jgi:hypothetical protein
LDAIVYEDKSTSTHENWLERGAHVRWGLRMLPANLAILFVGISLAVQFERCAVIFSILGATFLLMLVINVALLPTKYQIFSDRMRIVLGWILHFDISFSNIEDTIAGMDEDLWGVNFDLANSYSSDDILQINRKRGVKIYISPSNRKLFLEHLNKALTDWRRNSLR